MKTKFDGSVTIRKGYGFNDITTYQIGGDFRRAQAPIELSDVVIYSTFDDGSPREFTGFDGARKLHVKAECCEVDTAPRQ